MPAADLDHRRGYLVDSIVDRIGGPQLVIFWYGPEASSNRVTELREKLRGVDAALLGNDIYDANVFNAASRLKVVSRHGIGVDSVDLKAATENGIIVANTPRVNTTAVAEHTIALMLAILRKIPDADLSLKSKKWEGLKFVGEELTGKKLGIIGLGAIGKEVAKRVKTFGLDILYTESQRHELGRNVGLVIRPAAQSPNDVRCDLDPCPPLAQHKRTNRPEGNRTFEQGGPVQPKPQDENLGLRDVGIYS